MIKYDVLLNLPDVDGRRKPFKGFDDGEGLHLTPVEELSVNKMHRPDSIDA